MKPVGKDPKARLPRALEGRLARSEEGGEGALLGPRLLWRVELKESRRPEGT